MDLNQTLIDLAHAQAVASQPSAQQVSQKLLPQKMKKEEVTPRMLLEQAQKENPEIPKNLLYSIAVQETGGSTDPATADNGVAKGFLQHTPVFTKQYKVGDPTDPAQAIEGTVRALKHAYKVFGDWDKAVAAYTAGIKAVSTKGLDNLKEDERNYHKEVLTRINTPDNARQPGKAFIRFLDTPLNQITKRKLTNEL